MFLKLLLNLALLFLVVSFARRVLRGWLRPKQEKPPETPRRDDAADLGQGQKIEEADYEDLP